MNFDPTEKFAFPAIINLIMSSEANEANGSGFPPYGFPPTPTPSTRLSNVVPPLWYLDEDRCFSFDGDKYTRIGVSHVKNARNRKVQLETRCT